MVQDRCRRALSETRKVSSRFLRCPLFWAVALFCVCAVHWGGAVTIGWDDEIGGAHAFRQTQTAITSFYMVRRPMQLAYETPVLGPPWAIPFEFPLYQWIVAGITRFADLRLAQAGRLVGAASFLFTLPPIYWLLGALRVATAHRMLFLAVLLSSPFYIFWSRAFMIETLALGLAVAYAACAVLGWNKGILYVLSAAILGILAALVKVTTFLVFGGGVAIFLLSRLYRVLLRWPDQASLAGFLRAFALTVVAPLCAAVLWARFTDGVREQNPLGRLLSSSQLAPWTFGTVEQKLSLQTWETIISRAPTVLTRETGFWIGCLFAALITRRRWREIGACLCLYLAGPSVFTNLHAVHDYYMCANGIFLLAAVGFCILGISEAPGGQRAGFAAAVLAVVLAAATHRREFEPQQRQSHIAEAYGIKSYLADTGPESVIIYLGFDWSSAWPYYSERRALMIPEWQTVNDVHVREALANLRGYQIGAVIAKPNSRYPLEALLKDMNELGLDTANLRRH